MNLRPILASEWCPVHDPADAHPAAHVAWLHGPTECVLVLLYFLDVSPGDLAPGSKPPGVITWAWQWVVRHDRGWNQPVPYGCDIPDVVPLAAASRVVAELMARIDQSR